MKMYLKYVGFIKKLVVSEASLQYQKGEAYVCKWSPFSTSKERSVHSREVIKPYSFLLRKNKKVQ